MRLSVLILAALPAIAGADPVTPADVVRVEVYTLRDGRALGVEESTDRPPARPRAAVEEWSDPPPRAPARAPAAAARAPDRAPAYLPPGPGVPAARPFRDGDCHPTHTCPRCRHTSPAGSGTWVVRGVNPDGSHVHTCPVCGTSWRHR